jgi:hypothetical protein
MTPTPVRPAKHVTACGWFWAWAMVGLVTALSLDFGPVAALPAFGLGALVARAGDRRCRGLGGVITGAGLPLLWVAYVQRQGPGTTCSHTGSGAGCDQHLDPRPWLIIGVALVLAGLIVQSRRNRRS